MAGATAGAGANPGGAGGRLCTEITLGRGYLAADFEESQEYVARVLPSADDSSPDNLYFALPRDGSTGAIDPGTYSLGGEGCPGCVRVQADCAGAAAELAPEGGTLAVSIEGNEVQIQLVDAVFPNGPHGCLHVVDASVRVVPPPAAWTCPVHDYAGIGHPEYWCWKAGAAKPQRLCQCLCGAWDPDCDVVPGVNDCSDPQHYCRQVGFCTDASGFPHASCTYDTTNAVLRRRVGSLTEPFNTIQEAIRAAEPGDFVLVCAGEHVIEEPLVIDKPLAVTTAGMTTILRAGEAIEGDLVSIRTAAALLADLTIEGSQRSGIRMDVPEGVLELEDCVIQDNNHHGISAAAGSSVHLRNSTLSGNGDDDRYAGGGLAFDAAGSNGARSSLRVVGGEVSGNQSLRGGGIALFDTTFTIESTSIDQNIASDWGGGVYLERSAGVFLGGTVSGNASLARNTDAPGGGGLYVRAPSGNIELDGTEVRDNRGTGPGGGIHVRDVEAAASPIELRVLDGASIIGNASSKASPSGELSDACGGGVYCESCNLFISGDAQAVEVTGNTADIGAALCVESAAVEIHGALVGSSDSSSDTLLELSESTTLISGAELSATGNGRIADVTGGLLRLDEQTVLDSSTSPQLALFPGCPNLDCEYGVRFESVGTVWGDDPSIRCDLESPFAGRVDIGDFYCEAPTAGCDDWKCDELQ